MPVWWGNNGFQWGWVMGLFRGFAAAAAACVLPLAAGPVGAQQGLNDAERVRALEQTIRTKGSMIPGTNGAYICTVQEGLTVINVTSYKTGGVVEKKILTLWQGPSKVGPVSPVYNLYLQTEATSQRGGGDVSIKSTYDVIPEGQGKPLSEGVPLPTVVLPYISLHATKTHQALLSGMEEAVRIACKPKSEEPSYLAVAGIFPLFQR
jgi:hypothetical protein